MSAVSLRRITRTAGILLALGLACWWWWPETPAEPAPAVMERRTRQDVKKADNLHAIAGPAAVPEFGTEEFKRFALEKSAPWLASRNRDAASLIAVWDLSGDEKLLEEAARNFPDDARVCAAMVHRLQAGPEALEWAERLTAAEPSNPMGWYWKAVILSGSKKPEEALQALREATGKKGEPDAQLRSRMMTAREAALASGANIANAARVAVAGPLEKAGMPLYGKTVRLVRDQITEAKAAGDLERVADLAALGAASAEHWRRAASPTVMDEIVSTTMLKVALRELDPETEFGSAEKTVAQRQQELEAQEIRLKKLIDAAGANRDPWMMGLSDSIVSGYADRLILNGESAAKEWLASQTGEASP